MSRKSTEPQPTVQHVQNRPFNVLFLCTGNSVRSILAECIVDREGTGRFKGYSAGSRPNGTVNPFAIDLLRNQGFTTSGLRSKSWDEFARPGAPRMDLVITVCDDAAGEACPVWPGHPVMAHWGVADPAAVVGTAEQKRTAFAEAARILRHRIRGLVALPLETLDRTSLQSKLHDIGELR